jgi:NAD(P)-dependent dehydrogenase (short-subunit alcohol dehydrogenase family)
MDRYGEGYRREIETFLAGVAAGTLPSVNAIDGLRTAYLAEAAGASLRLGQVVKLQTNARGPFLFMQGVVRHLVETDQPGSIVNILSTVAHCGQSYLTPYSASKGALATLTKNVANAFAAKRIRCNGILTGWMDTPGESTTQQKFNGVGEDWLAKAEAAQPMGQLVKPDHLAGLVAYLLSPESGVMTGALVDYDQRVAGAHPE